MPCHRVKRLAVLQVRPRQSPAFHTIGQGRLGPHWRLPTYQRDRLEDPENEFISYS
jgi:hypothetical protein